MWYGKEQDQEKRAESAIYLEKRSCLISMGEEKEDEMPRYCCR